MLIERSCLLPCSPRRCFAEVETPRLLRYVSSPLVRFVAIDPRELPERWAEANTGSACRILGWIPFGSQVIDISRGEFSRRRERLSRPPSRQRTQRARVQVGPLDHGRVGAGRMPLHGHRRNSGRRLHAAGLGVCLDFLPASPTPLAAPGAAGLRVPLDVSPVNRAGARQFARGAAASWIPIRSSLTAAAAGGPAP